MANNFLISLLKDYEHKRLVAEMDLDERKAHLFSQFPRLKEIEDELNKYAISSAKSILLDKADRNVVLDDLNKKIETLKNERDEILHSNGYDLSFFNPTYECTFCNDTGYVLVDGKNIMCNCLKQRLLNLAYSNSNLYNLDSENFSNFNPNIFSDEVNFDKFGQNISPRKNILNIRDKALFFIDHFNEASCKNLLFVGKTGLQ